MSLRDLERAAGSYSVLDWSRIAIVTGARDWTDYKHIDEVLDAYFPGVVIHGGARGADAIAKQWAQRCAIEICLPYLQRFGKSGGPIRNQCMAELARHFDALADVRVIAFISESSRGTWGMIREAERNGIYVEQHFARSMPR